LSANLTHAAVKLKPSPFWPAISILFLGSFVGMYHVVSLNVSLHGFIAIFDVELQQVQWIITGFTLTSGMVAPISGYAMNRFGSKPLFLCTVAGITASSILCACAWNMESLIAFRVVQGLFCGFIQPLSLAMIYQLIEKDRQMLAVSIWSFSTILSTSIGPTLSGWLQVHNWHLIFLVTVPVGVVTLIMAKFMLPEQQGNRQLKMDWLGFGIASMGSAAFLLLFGNLAEWGWTSEWTILTALIAVASTGLFIWQQLRCEQPLLQLRLFQNAMYTLSVVASLVLTFALYAGVFFMPLFLEEVKGLSPYTTGMLFLPAAVCLSLATFWSGRLNRKFGPVKLLFAGSLLLLATTYYFSHINLNTSLIAIMAGLMIRNIGTGLSSTPVTNMSMSHVPISYAGHASALINWLRSIFSAMAIGICTSFFHARLAIHEKHLSAGNGGELDNLDRQLAYTLGIQDTFLAVSWIIALALPISLVMGKRLAVPAPGGNRADTHLERR